MSDAQDIELLFAIWEQNVEMVRALNRACKDAPNAGIAQNLVAYLKVCAVSLTKGRGTVSAATPADSKHQNSRPKIDKSVLTISEPKRLRSKEHLRFVARQPCLICGRTPAQAHHIRYAQPRGLGIKVSDEFTVPLCAIHHSENHATGDERRWWGERKIDPSSSRSAYGVSMLSRQERAPALRSLIVIGLLKLGRPPHFVAEVAKIRQTSVAKKEKSGVTRNRPARDPSRR